LKKKKLPKFQGKPGHLPPLNDEDEQHEGEEEKKEISKVAMSMEVKGSMEDLAVEGEENQ